MSGEPKPTFKPAVEVEAVGAQAPDRSAGPSTRDARSGQAPTGAGKSRSRAPLWAMLLATFFGIGRIRPGPGTWASLATVVTWGVIAFLLSPSLRTPVGTAAAIFVILIGIPAATLVARSSATKDPQFVVIDEVAGQLIALIAVPLAWQTFLAGFILFRAFDMVKPPPVRQLESLPDGAGIVLDDVAAGILAFLAMHLLLHFRLLN